MKKSGLFVLVTKNSLKYLKILEEQHEMKNCQEIFGFLWSQIAFPTELHIQDESHNQCRHVQVWGFYCQYYNIIWFYPKFLFSFQ